MCLMPFAYVPYQGVSQIYDIYTWVSKSVSSWNLQFYRGNGNFGKISQYIATVSFCTRSSYEEKKKTHRLVIWLLYSHCYKWEKKSHGLQLQGIDCNECGIALKMRNEILAKRWWNENVLGIEIQANPDQEKNESRMWRYILSEFTQLS